MTSGPASYHFLPWVRSGVAAGIKAPPTLGKTPQPEPGKTSIPSRAPMPVTLRLTGDMSSDDTPATRDDISPSLRMYGPGDVVGIDAREIVRTEPKHLTTDFPPHLFPFVEFDRPDFPWLFTPAAPDGDECLRPWIVLVVVRADLARITADPGRPLPTLECPPTELPDLDESWAWAHAQYVGDFTIPTGLPAALADRPLQTVSRLLCPRRLDPSSGGTAPRYYACLVPAFEAGRKAGLGEPLHGGGRDAATGVGPDRRRAGDAAGLLPLGVQHGRGGRLRGSRGSPATSAESVRRGRANDGPEPSRPRHGVPQRQARSRERPADVRGLQRRFAPGAPLRIPGETSRDPGGTGEGHRRDHAGSGAPHLWPLGGRHAGAGGRHDAGMASRPQPGSALPHRCRPGHPSRPAPSGATRDGSLGAGGAASKP